MKTSQKNFPLPSFQQTLRQHQLRLPRRPLKTLQINLGKFCNQACHHCHVEAGPTRTEKMTTKTARRLVQLLEASPSILTIDLTGGAPELNPNFRYLVGQARNLEKQVIDRCNLTVFFEKGQEDTPEFLAKHQVQVVASLPCYTAKNVEKQRGNGVFEKSIASLKRLNALGYGRSETGLILDLVYNPVGPFLPPPQKTLEKTYQIRLQADFGISFNRLLTITNMPIRRFLNELGRKGQEKTYRKLLVNHFNPATTPDLMCRELISVSWDGRLYDCDFNQMLELPISGRQKTIWDIQTLDELNQNAIRFADHCYGCTAGTGSSCGGALI